MNFINTFQRTVCRELEKKHILLEQKEWNSIFSPSNKPTPDYTLKIIHQYTDGDYVISEFIMRGTHKGDFLGITPTNKVLEITGVDIDRVVDGKIVEHSGSTETFETFWTNGLIKPV